MQCRLPLAKAIRHCEIADCTDGILFVIKMTGWSVQEKVPSKKKRACVSPGLQTTAQRQITQLEVNVNS